MNESKVAVLEDSETHFRVPVNVFLYIERVVRPYEVGPVQNGSRGSKYVHLIQKVPPADLATGHDGTRIRQPGAFDLISLQAVGAHYPDCGLLLRQRDHSLQTFREDPIVRENHLAVFAGRRDVP
jgi:hypothetical protein